MMILSRYIGKTVTQTILLVVLVLLGLELFVEFTREFSDIGTGNYGFWQAMLYVPLMLPQDTYQFFPMAGLLGSVMGLGLLAHHSEIIVMRASGWSMANISWAVIKAAAILTLFMIIIGEVLSPIAQSIAIENKTLALSGGKTLFTKEGYWVRDQDSFIHIEKSLGGGKIAGVTRYIFAQGQNNLLEVSYAKFGYFQNKSWVFNDIVKTSFTPSGKTQVTYRNQEQSNLYLHPRLLGAKYADVSEKFLPELRSYIKYRRQSGLNSTNLEFVFWQRIMQPLANLVMIILGVPFIFGPLRSANTGLRMLTGVVFGIGFYLINQLGSSLNSVVDIPPIVAALLPTLVFALIGSAVILRSS